MFTDGQTDRQRHAIVHPFFFFFFFFFFFCCFFLFVCFSKWAYKQITRIHLINASCRDIKGTISHMGV